MRTSTSDVLLLLVILVIYVTMVYGPIAGSWWSCSPPGSDNLNVLALPYRNGVRRVAAAGPNVVVRSERRYLLGPVVPDHRGGDDLVIGTLLVARPSTIGSADDF